MSAQGDKLRKRPDEDFSTRRTAEDELMRGDRGVGMTGDGSPGGSGAGGGVENAGSGSMLIDDADEAVRGEDLAAASARNERAGEETARSASTKADREPDVSDERGTTSGTDREGEDHNGPSGGSWQHNDVSFTGRRRASDSGENDNAREGYEDEGGSRDAEGARGESSGSLPGYG